MPCLSPSPQFTFSLRPPIRSASSAATVPITHLSPSISKFSALPCLIFPFLPVGPHLHLVFSVLSLLGRRAYLSCTYRGELQCDCVLFLKIYTPGPCSVLYATRVIGRSEFSCLLSCSSNTIAIVAIPLISRNYLLTPFLSMKCRISALSSSLGFHADTCSLFTTVPKYISSWRLIKLCSSKLEATCKN